jgi:DNA polymerase elongation subunit (family B)
LFESKARGQELVKNPCIPGVIVLDTYHWARNEKKYPSNTLNYVAFKILKKTKDDVNYKAINGLFHGTKEQKERLGRYNLKDSSLPREIVDKEQIVFGETEIARVTGITIEMYNVRGQSVKTESRLYRLTNAYGFLVPHDKTAGKTPEEIAEELRVAQQNSAYQSTLAGFQGTRTLKTAEERLNDRKARQAKYEGQLHKTLRA